MDCANDLQCAPTAFCAAGACAVKRLNGASCGGANQCETGFCVDGVCCDTACTGTCMACSAVKKGSGPDGTCDLVAAGTNPDNECPDQGAPSCGTDGKCDGAGSCRKYAAGTVCAALSCAGSILSNADLCDGQGACMDGGTQDCAPFLCAKGACPTACTTGDDCAPSAFCDGSLCTGKQGPGAACSAAAECQSGFCADGVCCDVLCEGACLACSAATKGSGADGTCGPVAPGTDPNDDCTDEGPGSCGTDGTCDGQGACRKYPGPCDAGTDAAPTQDASTEPDSQQSLYGCAMPARAPGDGSPGLLTLGGLLALVLARRGRAQAPVRGAAPTRP